VTNTSWTINIDQLLLSEAQERARLENQDLDQVVQRLLRKWVSSPSSAYDVYSVQPGDSLAQIASKFYGDARLYTSLAQFNGLAGSSVLRVGQKLRIPPLGDLPPAPSPRAAPEAQTELPAGLQIEYIQSPHYNERPADAQIWAIVIHATANDSLNGVIEWFTNPQSLVSAHYNIDKDGHVVQMAREEQRAWHAGKSQWKGIESVNDFSIGIELVNRNDGVDPYPEEQYQVCLKLCKYLVKKYGVQVEDIMSHRAISLTGKTDPAGFDMDRLRRDVAAG
jgi:N-acetylmuramoyl-L-alanine amidase